MRLKNRLKSGNSTIRLCRVGMKPGRRCLWVGAAILLLLILGMGGWTSWVYGQIEYYAQHDQADKADAIGVFGAAEYGGRPSPVFRARLDHAHMLYQHGLAPLIITLGGDGGDEHSEGSVGREYLMSLGIPEENIIAETQSQNTEESVRRIAVIARANGLRRLVIVSDGTHLFRIRSICATYGLDVLTSPRPRIAVAFGSHDLQNIRHEILSYTLWRLRLRDE